MEHIYRIGIDIGSTTIKTIVLDTEDCIVFNAYERHNAKISEALKGLLCKIQNKIKEEALVRICFTGSVGLGIAERMNLPFIQEVVAAADYVKNSGMDIAEMIDIGGEDAKIIFFKNNKATDLRMNGNCAGGTGAFIDQMALLLGIQVTEMDALAAKSHNIYPIASRCGVFSKTDVQNLIARNASREDIAASVLHAVAVQVVSTLAHGCEIKAPLMFCGGPLTYIGSLREAFANYLNMPEEDIITPEHSELIPAHGAAYAAKESNSQTLSDIIINFNNSNQAVSCRPEQTLAPIFEGKEEQENWAERKRSFSLKKKDIGKGCINVTLGIDSGSTTTKIVALDDDSNIVYSFYGNNNGDPIGTVRKGLSKFMEQAEDKGAEIYIKGGTSTGYGEDLIKAAFKLDEGIVETMAHYIAASDMAEDVSFILDIGGQDMKAIFVDNGVINRIEINEACSSGCGSFISTFATSLGYGIEEFANLAATAKYPYDLGTRCTVFMNSKVKQALRDGAEIDSIAAGLSYSVVNNCLYKVLRLKDVRELGDKIVVQGGTMKNDSIVRALEILTGKEVLRSDTPELMGAVGCALYARKFESAAKIEEILSAAEYETSQLNCKGCENQCLVTRYTFAGGSRYYSGNRCEKVFNSKGKEHSKGENAYAKKLHLLFGENEIIGHRGTVGIPRVLNMFEEYPFWKTIFRECGFGVRLSSPSDYVKYEKHVKMVMSDNICFPAKLVHSHIADLVDKGVDRIFMPSVYYEKNNGRADSYNCPIVSSYNQVVEGTVPENIPLDMPSFNFKNGSLFRKKCILYLEGLGVPRRAAADAYRKACRAQEEFEEQSKAINTRILANSKGGLSILLAGRPYHADSLIQHQLSDCIASFGVNVLTEDIVRQEDVNLKDAHFLAQWSFPNRILSAIKWASEQGEDIQSMELTSFGCGPDAFMIDETRDLMQRHGKTLTLLKVDDVCNVGSLKLRIRSFLDSIRLKNEKGAEVRKSAFVTTPRFEKKDSGRTILVPHFTPFISPLLPAVAETIGYNVVSLPVSDEKTCELGLKYANNEVCYPATLVVGDLIKALQSGEYDLDKTAVAMSQTGGQCRASNYMSLIKKAFVGAGLEKVPVISFSTGPDMHNDQPGFKLKRKHKLIPLAFNAILFGDCLARLYWPSLAREKQAGVSDAIKDKYLALAAEAIRKEDSKSLGTLLQRATVEFRNVINVKKLPRVGVVGEIYLKFNPFAHKDLCRWLSAREIEIIPPALIDFFLSSFINHIDRADELMEKRSFPASFMRTAHSLFQKKIEKMNRVCADFPYYEPIGSIFDKADAAKEAISLSCQFGEGWLLPGEIVEFVKNGVNDVISLQPFGCIANHIIARGMEKKLHAIYPDLNLLSLDFDSGVSDVNITNRLLLFIDRLKMDTNHL